VKVEDAPQDPDAPVRAPGFYYVRTWKGRTIIQTWPKKGARKVTQQEWWWRAQFGLAGRMAANALSLDYQTAKFLTQGTTMVPRDALTAAIYGRFFELEGPGDTQWKYNDHAFPGGGPPPPPDGAEFMWYENSGRESAGGSASSTAYATKGNCITPLIDLNIRGLRFFINSMSTGQQYRATLWNQPGNTNVGTLIAEDYRLAPANGTYGLQFDISADIPAGQRVMMLVSRTDQTDTFQLPIFVSPPRWIFPCLNHGTFQIAKANVQAGDPIGTIGTDSYGCAFKALQ
jgi:hypothetical protein